MTKLTFIVCFVILCSLSNWANAATLDPRWRLMWSDEFDGNTLDTTKWTARTEPGNFGNGEQQWYTDQAVSVSSGNLVIKTSKLSNSSGINGFKYISGKVDSKDKYFTTYGRWETRGKIPSSQGYWPAHWTLSQTLCWPVGAEFDIIEYVGKRPKDANMYYHYNKVCGSRSSNPPGATKTYSTALSAAYHIYTLEWWPTNFSWWIDNVMVYSFQTKDLAQGYPRDNSPHYYVLNTALGGGYPGNPDSTTILPNYHYIDYVRIYTWKTSCDDANVCSNHGCCYTANVTCQCDPGWYGSSCEYWWGSYVSTFVADDITMDSFVNGWGNGVALYLAANADISNGLTLTITNSGCPSLCGKMAYSSGAWNSLRAFPYGTFSYSLKLTKKSGVGVTLGVFNTKGTLLNQAAFILSGGATTTVQVATWSYNQYFPQQTVNVGYDLSSRSYNYTIIYNPDSVTFLIGSTVIYTATIGLPFGDVFMGIYFTANPQTFGTFSYSTPITQDIDQVTWLVYTNPATCVYVPPPPPPTPAPIDKCTGQFTRTFPSYDSLYDNIVNGWGNDYTLYLAPNVIVRNGLYLNLTSVGCPTNCGQLPYSGGGWQSNTTYPFGSYTFMAKGSSISGTGLSLVAAGPGGVEQIAIVLSGSNSYIVNISTWTDGIQSPSLYFSVPFDTSTAFHNYTVAVNPLAVTFIVDNIIYYVQKTGIPQPPFSFGAFYSAQPDWYGELNNPSPSSVAIQSVTFAVYPDKSCPGSSTSTSGNVYPTTNAGTTGLAQCSGYWSNYFYEFDENYDIIPDGWGNGFTFYSWPNADIYQGLTLTLNNIDCPDGCANMPYRGAGWQSNGTFLYGTFSFVAKSTKTPGTALTLSASDASGQNQISMVLLGNAPTFVNCTTFRSNYQYPPSKIALGFDASMMYHNYTFYWTSAGVYFYVDSVLKYTLSVNVPLVEMAFTAYYAAQPDWFGPFVFTGVTYTYLDQVSYTAYCPPPTTSTSLSSITAISSSTSLGSTSATSSTLGTSTAATTAAHASSTAGTTSTAYSASTSGASTSVAGTTAHAASTAGTTSAASTVSGTTAHATSAASTSAASTSGASTSGASTAAAAATTSGASTANVASTSGASISAATIAATSAASTSNSATSTAANAASTSAAAAATTSTGVKTTSGTTSNGGQQQTTSTSGTPAPTPAGTTSTNSGGTPTPAPTNSGAPTPVPTPAPTGQVTTGAPTPAPTNSGAPTPAPTSAPTGKATTSGAPTPTTSGGAPTPTPTPTGKATTSGGAPTPAPTPTGKATTSGTTAPTPTTTAKPTGTTSTGTSSTGQTPSSGPSDSSTTGASPIDDAASFKPTWVVFVVALLFVVLFV